MIQLKRKYALISGVSIIIMAIAAAYGYGFVYRELVIAGDASATASNLSAAKEMFGSSVLAWLIILICDLLAALYLYKFFETTDKKTSIITGLIRGLYSIALAIAIYQLALVLNMLYATDHDAVLIMSRLESFETIWSTGLILFGLHLLGLGYLSVKSTNVPKWMGWLLYLAGTSYTLINGTKMLLPDAIGIIDSAEMILSAPMAIAELGLAVWLIGKGGKQKNNLKLKNNSPMKQHAI